MPSYFHFHSRSRPRRSSNHNGLTRQSASAEEEEVKCLHIVAHSIVVVVTTICLVVYAILDLSQTEWIVKIWYIVIPLILLVRSGTKLWRLTKKKMDQGNRRREAEARLNESDLPREKKRTGVENRVQVQIDPSSEFEFSPRQHGMELMTISKFGENSPQFI